MNYPENAWLLLTHEGLYLMSSEEGADYHEKIELTQELKMTGITSIEGVPDDWFKQPRDLIISFQEGESPNSDLGSLKICTREPGSSVSLRKGPGTEFEKGLVQVGSGGKGVDDYFRERGYTIQDGSELIYVSEEKKGKDGHIWYLTGDNQWSAWVRSDFVCGKSGNLAGWKGSLFGGGEYPEDILLSSKDWDLLPVSGEEDLGEASMTFAITKSKEGDSLLVLYWSFGNCYFQVRFPELNGVQVRSVEEFIIDGKKQDTEKLSASELISLLRKGRTLVITENIPFKSQEYSLMGTAEVLKEVAQIADQLKLETFNLKE